MNVYYSFYELTPLKSANRLSSTQTKHGVHLKVIKRRSANFADYFPHMPLGDRHVEEFLEQFKYQDHEYDKKVFHFLLHEDKLSALPNKKFYNHELWDGVSQAFSPVVKHKLNDPQDLRFMSLLKQGIRVRLDANGLFTKIELQKFLKEIPDLKLIDYLEDPMQDLDWDGFTLPFAQDFIPGAPCEYIIHKPNARFYQENEKKIIMSSYLGSDLGKWHAYCELKERGDLNEFHGIATNGFYQEERLKFQGSYKSGFIPEEKSIKNMYNELDGKSWKLLCSI
jgi:hypothetical protein